MNNSNDEIYMGGYRCSMCDWFDHLKEDYSALTWFVAIFHTIIHSIQAAIDLK